MELRDEMIRRLEDAFEDAEVQLMDMTGGGDHWEARIVSTSFEGLSRLNRQRAVYAAMGELMHGPIHALTFKTMTPAEKEDS